MATSNLAITDVSASQNQKEVTINAAHNLLDVAITDSVDLDFTSGNVTLTDAQFRQNWVFVATNLSVARNLTVPATIKRVFAVDNGAGTAALSVINGTTTIVMAIGDAAIFYTDGTTNSLVLITSGAGGGTVEAAEGGSTVVAAADKFNFNADDFNITDETGNDAGIALARTAVGAQVVFNGAMVEKSADQTAVDFDTAAVAISFNQEVYDTNAFHDNATNNTRLTVPTGVAKVRIGGTVNLDLGEDITGGSLRVLKNGAVFDEISAVKFGGTDDFNVTGEFALTVTTGPVEVVATDYFELELELTGDTSVTVLAATTNFWIEVVEYTSANKLVSVSPTGAMVTKTADQTAVNLTTATEITWNSEVYDSDNFHDNATNNTRLTVPAGVSRVRVGFNLALANHGAGGTLIARIAKSGAVDWDGMGGQTNADIISDLNNVSGMTGPVDVVEGDYFELRAQITSATDTSVDIDASRSTFWIEVIDRIVRPENLVVNDQTGTTYSFALTDNGSHVRFANAAAITATVDPAATTDFPIGAVISMIQSGAGQVTVAAGGGVTINSTPGLKLSAQWSGATLVKVATNTWDLIGDLSA
jgi:hypothetical protein